MEIIEGNLLDMPFRQGPFVMTMGNFDGVHLGHGLLLDKLTQLSRENGARAAVLTFSPHPNQFLSGDIRPPLMTSQDKAKSMAQKGVDLLLVQKFDDKFSKVEPEDFLRQYLLARLELSHLILGYDFRFGFRSQGDFRLAHKIMAESGVGVSQTEVKLNGGGVISSTRIRQALQSGDTLLANELLGYHYSIEGVVVQGLALGRQLGFPTANLAQVSTLLPQLGVYAGYVCELGGEAKQYPAVLNLGYRPTLDSHNELSCECHVIGFDGNLYGRSLRFYFLSFLRGEQRFASKEELKRQIAMDVQKAKDIYPKKISV
jgi:riboflavin kinase / FMN adenylyltransferase